MRKVLPLVPPEAGQGAGRDFKVLGFMFNLAKVSLSKNTGMVHIALNRYTCSDTLQNTNRMGGDFFTISSTYLHILSLRRKYGSYHSATDFAAIASLHTVLPKLYSVQLVPLPFVDTFQLGH